MTEHEIDTPIQILLEKAGNYSTTSIQLIKLKVISNVSNAIANIITQLIIYLMLGVSILFCNIALAIWLGALFGKIYLGFLAVGIFYGIIALVLYLFQTKWMSIPFQNIFISKLNNK
jgi:hypothetical protein